VFLLTLTTLRTGNLAAGDNQLTLQLLKTMLVRSGLASAPGVVDTN
jgi:hypothetical protein